MSSEAQDKSSVAPMPLDGVRVLDLSRVIAGPFCAMLLGDFGAEVIKIEARNGGDPLRSQGAKVDDLSWYFAAFNRNKKSVAIDLRSRAGKDVLARLIASADILVENFRPGVIDQIAFPPATLAELNPGLIVCHINGFGETGPYARRPAFDFIAQAMSGFMSVNGPPDGPPMRSGLPLSDLVAGLYSALGAMAALHARRPNAAGQHVSVSLLDGMVSLLSYMSANYLATGIAPARAGNGHPLLAPYGLYRTRDGSIAIAASFEEIVVKLLTVLKLERLLADARFATNEARVRNKRELDALMEAVTIDKTTDEWIEIMNAAGVPCGPVLDLPGVFRNPQILHQEMLLEVPHAGGAAVRMTGFPVKMSETPCRVRMPAPTLGEHTEAVLASVGIGSDGVAALRRDGVI